MFNFNNMFLDFEIANNTTKFKNKFHYKMRFFIKKTIYQFLLIIFYVSIGVAQLNTQPGLLLSDNVKNNTKHHFVIFQEDAINIYSINLQSEYEKIWSYKFLDTKNIDPISILYGDITGNGESELIVLIYIFGEEPQIYIFPTDGLVPTEAPIIYNISSLKKGSRPIQAELIQWDGDKDKEIVITLSSPERKVVLLDYNINTLIPIEGNIAKEFMTTTYGQVHMQVVDYNQNSFEDLLLYTTGEKSKEYIYFSKNKNTSSSNINQGPVVKILPIKTPLGIENIISNTKGEVFVSTQETPKYKFNNKFNNCLNFSNNMFVFIDDTTIYLHEMIFQDKQLEKIDFITQKSLEFDNYIYNIKDNTMLFYDNSLKDIKLLLIEDPLKTEELLLANQLLKTKELKVIDNKKPQTMKEIIKEISKQEPTTKEKIFQNSGDTLYVNLGDSLNIPVTATETNTLKSANTTQMPKGMLLNSSLLAFTWRPINEDIGTHFFEYIIVQETSPTLQLNKEDSSKLSLERVAVVDTLVNSYVILVNDIPDIKIDNFIDTINVMGSFTSNYAIKDDIYLDEYKVRVIKPEQNTVLIDTETIYWEPSFKDVGLNNFTIQVFDGLAVNQSSFSVFVDTTINIQKQDTIAVLNEEFIYQLPYQPNYQYTIVEAPANLRISAKGEIHWIPLPTQVDDNMINIAINTGTNLDQYELKVYVNATPIISYRPAINEHITKGDTFIFNCQSFDLNAQPSLNWEIETSNTKQSSAFQINDQGQLNIYTDSLLDNQNYTLILSDGMNVDKFFGTLYINALPVIISQPPDYLMLGDTLAYQIGVQDLNIEKPFTPQFLSTSKNKIEYSFNTSPSGSLIDSTGLLFWVPNKDQLGSHSFDIDITDSLTSLQHGFTLFVNDKPNITSVDSVSILVGDTLNHFFNASDLNGESNLIYSIKTTIDELVFSGKAGKLTWVPGLDDIGLHTLEISVSDGFSASTDTQKLKVFVYIPPTLTTIPDSTAYANLNYIYQPKAYDMYSDSVSNKDIFISFISPDTLFSGHYDSTKNTLSWTPSVEELGLRRLEFIIKDKYNTENRRFYDINVLISPCETLDTLYINQTDTVYIENKNTTNQKIIIQNKSPFSPFP